MNSHKWLKGAFSGAIILLFVVSVIIGGVALGKESNKQAGILTLQVDTPH